MHHTGIDTLLPPMVAMLIPVMTRTCDDTYVIYLSTWQHSNGCYAV